MADCDAGVALPVLPTAATQATPLLLADYHSRQIELTLSDRQCAAPINHPPESLAALAGCWIYRSLSENAQADLINWQICLDSAGQGEQSVDLSDGVHCHGPVSATFSDQGIATISSQGATRCDTSVGLPQIIQRCRWTDGSVATCLGAQPTESVEGVPGHLIPLSLDAYSMGGGPE